jgi:hypothetical protein
MNTEALKFSTGLPGLDQTLCGLIAGDNVVWQVDTIEDYAPFVTPFWEEARRQGRKRIYFRFARHRELIPADDDGQIYRLHPEDGFERFLTEILDVIEKNGLGACYVFDWLSDLAVDWYSDRMLGNFFMIACPYLFDLQTIAYFGLKKNHHSGQAMDSITSTAQVVLEVYRKKEHLFLHPRKVWMRHSPTLYMLQVWEGEKFSPVTSSAVTADILSEVPQPWLDFSIYRPGVWIRLFRQAQSTLNAVRNGKKSPTEAAAFFNRILRMVVTRDERFESLAKKYFEFADLIEIMKRMIGTGLIGGKTLGMLLARAILKKTDPQWTDRLEEHDSFFIGSDVFYTYLVQNGCWWLRRRQKDFSTYLERATQAREKILTGHFPDYIQKQFMEMLEYYGQSPIIVRSSSLLEDNYGNAFSGKYESVFCANQGTPNERLQAFMAAVRVVYASTMSPEGLEYRLKHGLLDQDEQMALLVQRVSGQMYDNLFLPHAAGVGFSFNPYVWSEDIDPKSGFLRLVFGLGTRAVERTGDDYTRLVALNAPEKNPESSPGEARQFCQRRVDVLDLNDNSLTTKPFEEVIKKLPQDLLSKFAACDETALENMRPMKRDNEGAWRPAFDHILLETSFATDMRRMLGVLQAAYQNPVDIEFTANFMPNGELRINLVQCRPFQVKIHGEGDRVRFPEKFKQSEILLASTGPVIGHSLATRINRLIYIVPSVYGQMTQAHRYSVARTIGRLTHLEARPSGETILLIGPGRWGTSMPSLGVPVSFAEINSVSVLCEVALMREGLVPEISLGTHFFNDLVEMDMLYLAISPEREGHILNEKWLMTTPNRLTELLPDAGSWESAIRVIDGDDRSNGTIYLNVDSLKQRAVCYVERPL